MKPGMYFSKTENKRCYVYKQPHRCECYKCGKLCKNPTALVWEDDDEALEYIYGSECIKELKLTQIKE